MRQSDQNGCLKSNTRVMVKLIVSKDVWLQEDIVKNVELTMSFTGRSFFFDSSPSRVC